MFNKLIGFMKNWGPYDVYMVYLFGLRSRVARNNEPQTRKQPLLCYRSILCTPPPPPSLLLMKYPNTGG